MNGVLFLLDYISAVNLITLEPVTGTTTETVGWGRTSDDNEQISPELRMARCLIVSDAEAEQAYRDDDIDFAGFICVNTRAYGGPCNVSFNYVRLSTRL